MASPTPTCTVWWAAPLAPEGATALVGLLDAHERARLTRLRRPADRARYLAAHALARLVVSALVGNGSGATAAGLTFDRTCRCGAAHGKPVLPGGPGFSLSHSGQLVGVAVRPDGAVGLDVEQMREVADLMALAAHVQSPAETARADAPGPSAFFRAWTRKEALVKATGRGLATPMTGITLATAGAAVEAWTGDGAPSGPMWLRDLTPASQHMAAVAGPGERAPLILEADGDAVLRG